MVTTSEDRIYTTYILSFFVSLRSLLFTRIHPRHATFLQEVLGTPGHVQIYIYHIKIKWYEDNHSTNIT